MGVRGGGKGWTDNAEVPDLIMKLIDSLLMLGIVLGVD